MGNLAKVALVTAMMSGFVIVAGIALCCFVAGKPAKRKEK